MQTLKERKEYAENMIVLLEELLGFEQFNEPAKSIETSIVWLRNYIKQNQAIPECRQNTTHKRDWRTKE